MHYSRVLPRPPPEPVAEVFLVLHAAVVVVVAHVDGVLKVGVDGAGVVAHAQLPDSRQAEHAVLVEDVAVGGHDGAGADAVLAAGAREPLLLAPVRVLPVEPVQQVRLHELQSIMDSGSKTNSNYSNCL